VARRAIRGERCAKNQQKSRQAIARGKCKRANFFEVKNATPAAMKTIATGRALRRRTASQKRKTA
jgi:hypothetical protein